MKKLFVSLLLAMTVFTVLPIAANASDFVADENGRYTVEITGKTPGESYVIVVVAGDYTGKELPELSEENIIYINQVIADADGKISFTEFIPMTDSVGTVLIGSDDTPDTAGILMTESGFGYIAGRLISYSGNETTVTVPENITSIDAETFGEETERIIFQSTENIEISVNAFAAGTKLFLSPLANDIKQFAAENGYAYSVIGDFDGNSTTDFNDYKAVIRSYAKSENLQGEDLDIIMDLDSDGSITLNDASILLKYIGGKIADLR